MFNEVLITPLQHYLKIVTTYIFLKEAVTETSVTYRSPGSVRKFQAGSSNISLFILHFQCLFQEFYLTTHVFDMALFYKIN